MIHWVCFMYAEGNCDSNVPFCGMCSTQLRGDLSFSLLLVPFACILLVEYTLLGAWLQGSFLCFQRRVLLFVLLKYPLRLCYDHALLVTGYDVLLSTLQGNLSFSTSSASSFASTHAGPAFSSSLTFRLRHHALSDS